MAEPDEDLERVNLPAAWIGLEEVPIVFVNQIMAQLDDQGDAVITFGQASPPMITGTTPEERRRQAESIPFVQIRPVSRLHLSEQRLTQLIPILQTLADNQERVRKRSKDAE